MNKAGLRKKSKGKQLAKTTLVNRSLKAGRGERVRK